MQLAQSCHVSFAFSNEHFDITKNWMNISNYICILSAENEKELIKLIDGCIDSNVKFSIFRESDLDNQITAIAIEPGIKSKKICNQLKLALR